MYMTSKETIKNFMAEIGNFFWQTSHNSDGKNSIHSKWS